MSEVPKPSDVPPGSSVPATPVPGSGPAQPAGTTPAQPAATPSTAPLPARASAAPIEYALPAPKKPFTIPAYAGCLVKMIFGFAVLIVMGYCALVALSPKARAWATQGAKDGSGGPTPFNALNQILAIPAQAIGKTKDVVAASDARVGLLDKVIATDDKKNVRDAKPLADPFSGPATPVSNARAKAAAEGDSEENRVSSAALLALAAKSADATGPAPLSARPVPTVAPPPPGPAELKLAGGVVLRNSSPAGAPAASEPFMYWAAGLSISGVSNSKPARFLMNGRLVQEGDEVNKQLSVTFDHLDVAAKLIHFRDKNGAVVTRSY
jgi:hypothetical protein